MPMKLPAVLSIVCLLSTYACAQTTQPAKPAGNEATIQSLLKPAGPTVRPLPPVADAPAIDATSGKGAVAPTAPQITVVREGSFLVDRTGRLQRSADGQQMEFHFDTDGKTLKDPPVVVLPNLKLMQMENAVTGSSRDLRFRITGMVTEYRGRNYVLLEKVVVVPDAVQPF
jgi:hypothetical protein